MEAPHTNTLYLRLESRHSRVYTSASHDGKIWRVEGLMDGVLTMDDTVQIGVFAASGGKSKFRVTFDQFE